MNTWKLILEYDGTRYSGWQTQKNARTIQGELQQAAADYFGRDVDIQGAGRTDAGVHARAQVAHLRVDERARRNPDEILRVLNAKLPADIAVLSVEEASSRFHARHDALTRCYVYQVSTRKTAFGKKYVWWVKEDLDLELMARAAGMLAGRRDFVQFRAADPSRPDESTIVVVDSAEVEVNPPLVFFRVEASHFLWRMVRRVAGVLVKLGKGEITEADYEMLLEGRSNPKMNVAAWTAPAAGLFLESVRYRPEADSPLRRPRTVRPRVAFGGRR